MSWIKQHCESGRIVVVARVNPVSDAGGRGFGVFLAPASHDRDGSEASQEGNCYSSRDGAFAAADALVKHRHGGHVCVGYCAGWVLDPSDPGAASPSVGATAGT